MRRLVAFLLLVSLAVGVGGCESMIRKILNNGENGPSGLPGRMK